MSRGPFRSPAPWSPFDRPSRRPEQLADENGAISAADEVADLRRAAMADWLGRNEIGITVDRLEARAAEVGSDVACAEALAGQLSDE